VIRAGVPLRKALGLAVASDTVSIATMELVEEGANDRSARLWSSPAFVDRAPCQRKRGNLKPLSDDPRVERCSAIR